MYKLQKHSPNENGYCEFLINYFRGVSTADILDSVSNFGKSFANIQTQNLESFGGNFCFAHIAWNVVNDEGITVVKYPFQASR